MKLVNRREHIIRRLSRPARGAWIEIPPNLIFVTAIGVAPRKGRVD